MLIFRKLGLHDRPKFDRFIIKSIIYSFSSSSNPFNIYITKYRRNFLTATILFLVTVGFRFRFSDVLISDKQDECKDLWQNGRIAVSFMQLLYGPHTAIIRPLPGHYTAIIRPIYDHNTAFIRLNLSISSEGVVVV